MRAPADYIAQQKISHNGVTAYNPGDDVPASAVENLGLTVGVEVLPAHAGVIPRPAGNARRAEWERYAIGQGMTPEEAADLTRGDLIARYPDGEQPTTVNPDPAPDLVAEQATEQTNGTAGDDMEPPARDARKADWVAYAVARGMPAEVAEDSTIAQLSGYDYDTAFGRR